jgi:hypothetical protein
MINRLKDKTQRRIQDGDWNTAADCVSSMN